MSTAVSLDTDPSGNQAGFPSATNSGAASVESVLESGLAQVVPGFELLDRTLEIADRTHVHLVGIDRAGALVLVALAPGDGETAPVRALEAMEFVDRNREPLLRHLKACSPAAARLDGALQTRYLVVADLFSERTRRRLEPLQALGVEAYELKSLRSQGHKTAFLHSVLGRGAKAPAPISELSSGHLRLTELLRRRLAGLDERVESERTHAGVVYRVESETVAELDLQAGRTPSGRTPGGPARPLDSASAVDDFVAEIVETYLRHRDSADSNADDLAGLFEPAVGGASNGAGLGNW